MLKERTMGTVCLWAGLLGAASGIFLAVVPEQVDDGRFSYPLTAGAFIAIQIWFFVQHLGLLAGIQALASFDVAGSSRMATVGHWFAGLGMLGLTLTELWAIVGANAAYPSSTTDPLDAAYGITSTAIGVGLVLVGIGAARAGRWTDWTRWLPLGLGVYVFVPMFPAMFGPFIAARLGITGWMVGFALLGRVIVANTERSAVTTRRQTALLSN